MNQERRKKLEQASSIIEEVRDEEQEAYDNLPPSLQDGDRGDVLLTNAESLTEIISMLDDIINA